MNPWSRNPSRSRPPPAGEQRPPPLPSPPRPPKFRSATSALLRPSIEHSRNLPRRSPQAAPPSASQPRMRRGRPGGASRGQRKRQKVIYQKSKAFNTSESSRSHHAQCQKEPCLQISSTQITPPHLHTPPFLHFIFSFL